VGAVKVTYTIKRTSLKSGQGSSDLGPRTGGTFLELSILYPISYILKYLISYHTPMIQQKDSMYVHTCFVAVRDTFVFSFAIFKILFVITYGSCIGFNDFFNMKPIS
jgi:hypothetical protein